VKLASIIFALLGSIGMQSQGISARHMTPQEFYYGSLSCCNRVMMLDLRSPEEYKSGHIPKAKNLPWTCEAFAWELERIERTFPIFIYCSEGLHAPKVMERLVKMGFSQVYLLKGGIQQWKKEKLDISSQAIEEDYACDIDTTTIHRVCHTTVFPVLFFYESSWCIPCDSIFQTLKLKQKQEKQSFELYRISLDYHPEWFEKYQITDLPAIAIYESNVMKAKASGSDIMPVFSSYISKKITHQNSKKNRSKP
jgi:thioredoxin 1